MPPSQAVSRWLRRILVALIAATGVVLVAVIGWGVDLGAHDGKVVRNVRLAGRDVGGMRRADVAAIATRVASEFEGARIRVSAPGGGFATDASTLGVSVSETSTVEAAFAVGRDGPALAQLWGWVRSFVDAQEAPLRVRIDRAHVYRTVRDLDPGPRTEPKEPGVAWDDDDDEFEVVDGEKGRGIDAADVIDGLPDAAARGAPFIVAVGRGDVDPRWSDDAAEDLAERAAELVDRPVFVRAGDDTARLATDAVRRLVRAEATDEALRLTVDRDETVKAAAAVLEDAGEPAVETRFEVEGGSVRILAGRAGTRCCADSAADRLAEALFPEEDADGEGPDDDGEDGEDGGREGRDSENPVVLPLEPRPPSLTVEEARALKVTEVVGSFRTPHRGGEPRVRNIHRIADLVRGVVIEPGKSFSVNKHVGRRTTANGFVAAPVIEEGRFSEGVGGGVSQFATTLFNAAFFAGLEFEEYQSHSIYISRYPYGREATLSYPKPDLVIENTTPYGVLVWPTYDNTSITVTLYSTKYVEAVQSGQSESQRGNCRRVSTERTRTYLDGRKEVDRVFATYRPEEGVNC